jgi:hypothetical protein
VAETEDRQTDLTDEVRTHLRRVMHGVTTSPDTDPGFAYAFDRPSWRFPVDRQRLPVPDIVRLVFSYLGSINLGRAEKLAWEHTFRVDGVPCSIASQKFSISLYIGAEAVADEAEAEALSGRIVGAVIAGQRVIERDVLRPLADAQMRQGNITIRNQYHSLRRAYSYFREGATLAYAGDGRLPNAESKIAAMFYQAERHEGWWNTFAMVTAYFSLIEHVFVGCLSFADFDPTNENVTEFIGSKWGEKYNRIFGSSSGGEVSRKFHELRSISESYRNAYGHGGFDRAGSTVSFHVPGLGAIPATLSDIRTSPHFNFVPVTEQDFESICTTFDEFDNWLASGEHANALAWIERGLDYRFDAEFRTSIVAVGDGFNEYLDVTSQRIDMIANMDW